MVVDSAESRRSKSARHYLSEGVLAARLEHTLVLAARTLGFSSAMVNILDEDAQHTVAVVGGGHWPPVRRDHSLCDVALRGNLPLAVEDAKADQRFADLPVVVDSTIGSYVGVPLVGRESLPIGVLCVLDRRPQAIDDEQVARLVEFGKVVEDQLDLIRRLRGQRRNGQVATAELANAIADGAIVPWFQPVIELATGRLVGFEALARWEHASGRVELPSNFVPLAEDSDLIIDLDLAVMRQALVALSRWQQIDPSLRMAVNFSAHHFDRAGWILPFEAAAVDSGVSPGSVDLELTETSRFGDGLFDGRYVQQLRDRGFRVWLDDFGTGWSSLEYLLRLPADGIKIDRAISMAMGSQIGNALTRSVTGLAHEMGMRTTVEGVESAAIAALALDLGCDDAQGYLWSTPIRAADVDQLFHQQKSLSFAPARSDGPSVQIADPQQVSKAVRLPWTTGEELATAVLDAIPDATAILDELGKVRAVNHAWRMYSLDNGGSDETSGVGVNYLEVCERAAAHGSADARQVADDIRGVLAGRFVETEMEYPCPSPSARRWFLLRVTRLAGAAPGVVASHVNITRRKMAEEELTHAAFHDPLTGLANRTLFYQRLARALKDRAGRAPAADIGVLYLDLDGFKMVNDTFGHGAGDEVLLNVAFRLRQTIRPGSTISRLGGDEFAVTVPRIDLDGLTALARRIDVALAQTHRIHGHLINVGASLGTHLATAGDDAADALHRADKAMYAAKQARRRALP